jgi:hypothetical protein
MKRRLLIATTAALLAIGGLAAGASAHTGPCDTGEEYALGHIVPAALSHGLGAGGHIPGAHQGYANVPDVCDSHYAPPGQD